jgi:glycosyltransferase involved in cell wall biosynthesis
MKASAKTRTEKTCVIEVLHPALRNYRLDLFEKLDRKYSIKFIFTVQINSKDFGGIQVPTSWAYDIINVTSSMANWFRLAIALLRDDYEILITSPGECFWDIIALAISKLRHKKTIFWGESWYWPSKTLVQYLYYHIFLKYILNHTNAIIAMGERQFSFYSQTLNRTNGIFYSPKYVISYKERDTSELLQRLSEKNRNILSKKIILYMSRIIESKGLDYLIRAFKLVEGKINDAFLLIVGSGPFEPYCKKLSEELQINNIMFIGYIPDSDIELYHNLSNVLVLPSVFFHDHPEPDGYVLYESMSIGKPLIITDAVRGGTPELIRDGVNGYVVKNRSVNELVDALIKIIDDEMLERKMSQISKKIFNEKISLQKQFDAFDKAIDYVRK